jgi:hypothetical protein
MGEFNEPINALCRQAMQIALPERMLTRRIQKYGLNVHHREMADKMHSLNTK